MELLGSTLGGSHYSSFIILPTPTSADSSSSVPTPLNPATATAPWLYLGPGPSFRSSAMSPIPSMPFSIIRIAAPVPTTALPPVQSLCNWTKDLNDCRDSDFTKTMLIVSIGIHIAAGIYGMWILAYRNRGFNHSIVMSLFSYIGNGLQPKPFDCHVFFASAAFILKIPANLFLILDLLPNDWWCRIFFEQIHWVFIVFSFTSYFVGLLYAMPITERKGIFAVYVPEVVPGSPPLPPIHILAPTPMQKNCILVVGIIWPTVASCLGITSGVLHNRGDLDGAKFWFLVQYSTWTAVLFSLSMCFYYYGFKYMFILRANIIIAEEALNTPRSSFGIGLLASKSPARFLLATLHFTGIGGGSVTFSAGLMTIIWLVMKDYILSRSDERWVHIMSFIWTTGMAPAYSIIFVLTHLLSVRSRRRGVHDHTQPNRISSEFQRKPRKSAGKEESDKDLEAGTINDVPDQGSMLSSDLSSTTKWSSDGNHKAGELLARTPEPYQLCSSSANRVVESEPDGHSLKIVSLNPPPRPVKSSFGPTSIANLNAANPSVLHEFVFGGETRGAHHRASSSNSGLPVSLFSLHAVPFASRRYQSRPLPSLPQQFPPTKQNDDGPGPFDATTSDGEIRRSGGDQPLTKRTNEDAASTHCTHRQAQEVDKETEAVDLATVEQVVIEMDDVQRQIEMHQQDSEAWLAVPIVYK